MMKQVTRDTRVAELLAARPDLRWTLVAHGLTGLADESHLPPPERTLGQAGQRHGADVDELVAAADRAWQQPADTKFVAEMKQKFAGFKGGCCGHHH